MNDAWRRVSWADALYACDLRWWQHRAPSPAQFGGDRWSSIGDENTENTALEAMGVRLMKAKMANEFSTEPGVLHFGWGPNSGFQAIGMAIQFGARHVILCGFDMRHVDGQEHFWGAYQGAPFVAPDFGFFIAGFDLAAKVMPPDVRIVNATPGSALTCFPSMSLEDALDDRLLWNRSEHHAAAS